VTSALRRMSEWEQSERQRMARVQELHTVIAGNKNGVEDGYDANANSRLLVFRCIGDYAVSRLAHDTPVVVPSDIPRCSVVFPGTFLHPDGRIDSRIDQFSYLTLGLCPNCLTHYRIQDVHVPQLFQSAHAILHTRMREQQWSEPIIRPAVGVNQFEISDTLKRETLANKKRKSKTVIRLLSNLQQDLAACVERLDDPHTRDPLSVVKAMQFKIFSETSQFGSDDMSDEHWTTLEDMKQRINSMVRLYENRAKGATGGRIRHRPLDYTFGH